MLKNIKSAHISKSIFTLLNDSLGLKLIKYNKTIQKKINISLINYKLFSGKNIVYENNTKGKEYIIYNNILIYEGEYLNGRRNGKGKEYNNEGKLIYEGEYLDGKRHGKGKEYNKYGGIAFDGEYLNGKRWTGKGYGFENNNIIYELIDGKGNLCLYFDDNNFELKFKGNYSN